MGKPKETPEDPGKTAQDTEKTQPRHKSTKIEYMQRVQTVKGLIARAKSAHFIVDFAAQKWKISRTQAYRYMKDAREEIIAEIEVQKEGTRATHLFLLREVMEKAWEENKLSLLVKAIETSAKLSGLMEGNAGAVSYIPKQINLQVEGPNGNGNAEPETEPTTV